MELSNKERLSEKQIALLMAEMMKSHKQAGFAYVLLVVGGLFGLHKFYLERTAQALLYFFLGLVVVLSNLITFSSAGFLGFLMGHSKAAQTMGFGFLLSIVCLIILICLIIYDLFTLPEQVRRFNDDLEEEIVQALLSTKPEQDTPATATDDNNNDPSMEKQSEE